MIFGKLSSKAKMKLKVNSQNLLCFLFADVFASVDVSNSLLGWQDGQVCAWAEAGDDLEGHSTDSPADRMLASTSQE